MARDRFSNQRKENYSRAFRYGLSDFEERKPKPKPLPDEQQARLRFLLCFRLTEWENNFLKTILNRNVELSEKQNDICSRLLNKYKI